MTERALGPRHPDIDYLTARGLRASVCRSQIRSYSSVFYQSVVGFRVIDSASTGLRGMGTHESDSVLLELHEKPGVRPVPRRGLLGLVSLR